MISFECDYNNGACQQVIDNLVKYNSAKPTPYGFDEFSDRAKARIREACGLPDAQIFFLTGGTQTNATTIDSMLYQYEGVICVGSGHINVHEAGAVEFTEHKIIALPEKDGKLEAMALDKYLDDYMHDGNKDHAVHPGLVYITFPTEFGTLYSAKELSDIYQVCQRYEIPLYIDGARLGYGLKAVGNDISLPQKQHGAVIAKGALIGLQFDALFTDDLYMKLSEHAIKMAMRMKEIFTRKGFEFYHFGQTDRHHTICRFVTSWATTEEEIDELERILG